MVLVVVFTRRHPQAMKCQLDRKSVMNECMLMCRWVARAINFTISDRRRPPVPCPSPAEKKKKKRIEMINKYYHIYVFTLSEKPTLALLYLLFRIKLSSNL